jgi:hypothetical protein
MIVIGIAEIDSRLLSGQADIENDYRAISQGYGRAMELSSA